MPGFSLVERGQIVLPVQWYLKEGLSQLERFQYFVAKKLRQGLSSDHFLIWKCWSSIPAYKIPDTKEIVTISQYERNKKNGWLISTPTSLVIRVHPNPCFLQSFNEPAQNIRAVTIAPIFSRLKPSDSFISSASLWINCQRIFDNLWLLGRI